MSRELVLYCDESDISGRHFSNFYGGALVESRHLEEVVATLAARKAELNLGAEVKWQKISEAYADKYMALLETVFLLVREAKLKLRVMFTQNYFAAKNLTREQRERAFFVLYYQFVKHAFGLQHSAHGPGTTHLRIYFDKLPDKAEKCAEFKDYVVRLNMSGAFREARVRIRRDQLAEIDSKEHVILQALDLVMGAMQFRLNDKHLEKPAGQRARGKRTRAKEAVYKFANAQIRSIYPGFNIGVSTGVQGDAANRWRHGYRHWLFMPAEVEIRPEYAKGKQKSPAPAT
ncbi:DUF3800 domain-containing protein [Achromobacter xylosoxidans]|uniref:DUF3800 domain-containing protein n=1 Tax=Alcaligenes xylosoxydans xylosoxydans TaxID=85698 RepID=UPI000B493988|nr:DUF3800 domain-containing protein [Achromobacter xylosoxidans]